MLKALVLFGTIAWALGSKLVHEQVETYRKILESIGKTKVDVEGLVFLMSLSDGNPKYNTAAIHFIAEKLGEKELSWTAFEKLVDKIYGDQISDDPYQPQEIHIALTNDTSIMKVMWVTMATLDQPVVQFLPAGDTDWSNAKTASAISYTYTVPQKWWPIFTGMIYEADMSGLQPDQRYQYRVGGWDSANATTRYSQVFNFKAAPISNNPSRATTIAAMADQGTFMFFGFATTNKMVELQEELGFEMAFVAGDLSYAGLSSAMPKLNISKEDEFEHVWDLLFIQNQPIAANYPWMVGNGNHERFYDWTAYMNRYKMPQNTALNSNGNFWYSFNYGNVHWVSISSEHDLSEGSPQKTFLRAALEAAVANRGIVPWIVVTLHKPLYCSDADTPSGYADKLEDIFLEFDVDLVITGHLHAYERVHPVNKGVVTVLPVKDASGADVYHATGAGPLHIMQGNAGGMQVERWDQPQPAWSAFRMANGYIVPNITKEEDAAVEFVDGVAVDFSDESTQTDELLFGVPLLPEKYLQAAAPEGYNYIDTYGFGVLTAYNATHLFYKTVPDTQSCLGCDKFWIVKDHTSVKK